MTEADLEPDPWVEPTHSPLLELIVSEPENTPELDVAEAEEALAEVVDYAEYFHRRGEAPKGVGKHGVEYLQSNTKRMYDLTVATAIAPLVGIVWPAMRDISQHYCDEDGFYLETQVRTGYNELPFEINKFRTLFESLVTMYPDSAPGRNDDRTDDLGNAIRNLGPDEIAQLTNVLDGTMSTTGPRPILPWEIELMIHRAHDKPLALYWQEARALGLPGIWGPGQMLAHQKLFQSNPTGRDQQMLADIHYVENASLLGDMAILGRLPGQAGSMILNKLRRSKS